MPIAAADLIRDAAFILQDTKHARWTVPELLGWINDAARETIVRRPAARAVTVVLALAAGTLQRLPDGAVELLDVTRNMTANPAPPPPPPPPDPTPPEDPMLLADDPDAPVITYRPGRSIRRVDRQLLDDQMPDWHMARQKNAIKHYTFDERSPATFYVYPPAIENTNIEVLFSEIPPAVADEADTLDMGKEYTNPLVEYVVYRALSKDSEYGNGTVAALHYQAFVDAVTDNNAKTTANSPNQNSV